MWTSFFLACLLFGVILYVPGILVLGPFFRSNGMGLFPVLAAAPIVTLFPLAVLSELFGYMGIPMNAWVVVLFAVCLCFAGLLVGSRRAGRSALTTEKVKKDISVVVAYVAIGCVVAGVIYVKSMDGPASIFPEFDNASHLALVRVFADSGKWSSLQSSPYLPSELGILTSAGSTGFYPSLWHACCAFLVDFLSVSVPVAINAVNAVAVSVVFPLSLLGFMSSFASDRRVLFAGAITSSCFIAFPWHLMVYGPVYPNLFGDIVLPAVMMLFVMLASFEIEAGEKRGLLLLFLAGSFALALMHPNTIFAAMAILAPLFASRCSKFISDRFAHGKAAIRVAVGLLCFAIVALVWLFCFHLPAFAVQVNYHWTPETDLLGAVQNALTLKLVTWSPSQPLLSVLVLVGLLSVVAKRRSRWLLVSYAITLIMFVVVDCAPSESLIRHLFTGFWYNDIPRIASVFVMVLIPIAAFGLVTFADGLAAGVCSLFGRVGWRIPSDRLSAIGCCFFGLLILSPFQLFSGWGPTPVRLMIDRYVESYSFDKVGYYTHDERDFVNECLELVGDDAIVYNCPFDGSCFSYGEVGLRTAIRTLWGTGAESELSTMKVLREGLDEVSYNVDVQSAVKATGIEYVLMLDQGNEAMDESITPWGYHEDQWVGFNSIDDDTPGFTLVLRNGDMALYKIDSQYL